MFSGNIKLGGSGNDEMYKVHMTSVKKANRTKKNENKKNADELDKISKDVKRKDDEKNRGKPFGGKMKMVRSEPPAFKK